MIFMESERLIIGVTNRITRTPYKNRHVVFMIARWCFYLSNVKGGSNFKRLGTATALMLRSLLLTCYSDKGLIYVSFFRHVRGFASKLAFFNFTIGLSSTTATTYK